MLDLWLLFWCSIDDWQGSYTGYCAEAEASIRKVWHEAKAGSQSRLNSAFLPSDGGLTEASPSSPVPEESPSNVVPNSKKQQRIKRPAVAKVGVSQRNLHNSCGSHGHPKPDTILFPTLQMKCFNITYDSVSKFLTVFETYSNWITSI